MIIIITYKNVVVVAAAKSIKECILILFFLGGEQKLFQSIRRYSVTKSGKSLVKFHWQQWFESLFSIWQNIEPILAYVFAIEANFDPSKFQNLEFLVKHLVTLFVTI